MVCPLSQLKQKVEVDTFQTDELIYEAHIKMKDDEFPFYLGCTNDERLHRHVQKVGKLLLGPENINEAEQIMASEDFAFYQQVIPGVIFNIGIRNERLGSIHSPHYPHFFLNEDVLPIGAALHTALAQNYLNHQL
nr:IAA-amino acid hydrolase ILR1-like 5 [Ipomoea batatas]